MSVSERSGPDDWPDEVYLTRAELGDYLRVSSKTVERWQREGLPAEVWGRRLIRYRLDRVKAWLNTKTRT